MGELSEYGLGPRAIGLIKRGPCRTIYVIGDSDTGKSSLVAALVRELRPQAKTAAVDLDAGQATVGPPTTFGWHLCGRAPYGKHRSARLYFLGSTLPAGCFDLAVAGAAAMVNEARSRAEKVVVDTCGLARGDVGRRLHQASVDTLRPDLVIGIQRRDELETLLDPLRRAGWPRVLTASVPEGVKRRSWKARRTYRRERFRAYFESARMIRLSLDEVGILRLQPDPAGRIASLRDGKGRDIALAIVQDFAPEKGRLTVLSPVSARARVRAVVLGSMRIARDGRQLERNI